MLRAMSGKTAPLDLQADRTALAAAEEAIWLDLQEATEAERHQVERACGLRVPDLHEVTEIESSSRLVNEGGVLYLTTPMVSRGADGTLQAAVRPASAMISCRPRWRRLAARAGASARCGTLCSASAGSPGSSRKPPAPGCTRMRRTAWRPWIAISFR
jgi:hypothetical protein